jgi:RNA polymerase sigma factor (sigma-70 family)
MNAQRFNFSHMKALSNDADAGNFSCKDESVVWDEFLNGSDSALAYFYRMYAPKLYNYGKQFVSDSEIVSDSIQDLFFEMIDRRKKLGRTTSIKNYLYASLRRRLIRIQEKNRKKISSDSREGGFEISFFLDDHTPMDQFSTEQISLIEKACNELPERQREAIILLFYEDLGYEDLAKIMNIGKVRSARALIYRAIESLKNILNPIKSELLILALYLFV